MVLATTNRRLDLSVFVSCSQRTLGAGSPPGGWARGSSPVSGRPSASRRLGSVPRAAASLPRATSSCSSTSKYHSWHASNIVWNKSLLHLQNITMTHSYKQHPTHPPIYSTANKRGNFSKWGSLPIFCRKLFNTVLLFYA